MAKINTSRLESLLCFVILWMSLEAPATAQTISTTKLETLNGQVDTPQLTDPRLQLTLFAESPDIVTPIGLTIDRHDRIYVIESHTHLPPRDYRGPKGDLIKVFVDQNNDGQADGPAGVFARGLNQAMNLALSPDGILYVVCAREVVRLPDANADGQADEVQQVLKLETAERYAHNSLLGITFDDAGKMYLARGNTGSREYFITGPDGSRVDGYGDGGSVIRCNSDGTQIEEFATGFWNPFDLKFDLFGNLLLVDNDPDARGPNRLVKVVQGGDYGYKSMFGGGGNHPFQGWDGSLPGTLPYLAGVGEAPSGVIDMRRTSFPHEYNLSVLATIWNENSIERIHTPERTVGDSSKTLFMRGPKDFRPVALDCDSKGNLYVSDWVDVAYPNHGRGRIWRVSNSDAGDRMQPARAFHVGPESGTDSATWKESDRRMQSASATGDDKESPESGTDPATWRGSWNRELLVQELSAADPFRRHAAIQAFSDTQWADLRREFARSSHPGLRLVSLLAQKKQHLDVSMLDAFLKDDDVDVRRAALQWAAESFDPNLLALVDGVLEAPGVTAELFDAWIAARQCLDPDFCQAVRNRNVAKSNQIPIPSQQEVLVEMSSRPRLSTALQALAIRRLSNESVSEQRELMSDLLHAPETKLREAIVAKTATVPDLMQDSNWVQSLERIANDSQESPFMRVSAIWALERATPPQVSALQEMLASTEPEVAYASAGVLHSILRRSPELSNVWKQRQLGTDVVANEITEQLAYGQHQLASENRFVASRPTSLADWQRTAAEGGDAKRGQFVFYSERVGCSKCHSMNAHQATLGPGLAEIAASKSRDQIVESIIEPSADFPPQYQAWVVLTIDGQVHRGLQLDHKAGGAIVLTAETGESIRFSSDEIEDYAASPTSLMPEGLADSMTVSEFRDLVAFLMSGN